jgi:hypothetical protein
VIGHIKRKGQHRIGMKRRESGVIGWRGWKIEAGGRDSVVIGRKERAKRREAGEEILIGWRARREKVWGGDTRVHESAGRREGREEGTR